MSSGVAPRCHDEQHDNSANLCYHPGGAPFLAFDMLETGLFSALVMSLRLSRRQLARAGNGRII